MSIVDFFKKQPEEFRPQKLLPLKTRDLPRFTRGKENQSIKGDGKWILGFLLGSILLSVGFWLWGNLSRGELWRRTDTVVPVSSSTPIPTLIPKKTQEITDQVSQIIKNLKGSWGFYVFNLTTKQSYGDQENEVFPAASLIKLPVILTLYQEVEAGRIDLSSKYVLKQADKQSGAGSMQYKPAGTIYTYRQMVELMGQQSDNTAFMVFRQILGDQKIQETINDLGMSRTSLSKNETVPIDIGLFFRKLYGGSIVSRDHRDEILGFLTKTAFEDRIPAGVPPEIRVAHKIGNEVGVFSDAGIVFAEKPFILVILSKNALEKEAKTALPEITKAVWEFENK